MRSLLEDAGKLGKLGLLASRVGITSAEAAAVRRHAEREESSGDCARAAETYRAAALIEPGERANWEGLARCLAAIGDRRAVDARRVADAVAKGMS